MCQASWHIICTIGTGQAKKFSSSFTLNSDESVILQKLSLNVLALRLKKNSLLFLLSIESSLESVEGSGGNFEEVLKVFKEKNRRILL